MTVAIVDYGSGNLHSAAKAFERAARESASGEPILVTNDPEKVRGAALRTLESWLARILKTPSGASLTVG